MAIIILLVCSKRTIAFLKVFLSDLSVLHKSTTNMYLALLFLSPRKITKLFWEPFKHLEVILRLYTCQHSTRTSFQFAVLLGKCFDSWFRLWSPTGPRVSGWKIKLHTLCFLAAEQCYIPHTVLQSIGFWKQVRPVLILLVFWHWSRVSWGKEPSCIDFSFSLLHKLCGTPREYLQ